MIYSLEENPDQGLFIDYEGDNGRVVPLYTSDSDCPNGCQEKTVDGYRQFIISNQTDLTGGLVFIVVTNKNGHIMKKKITVYKKGET